jgi:hypothetical protein
MQINEASSIITSHCNQGCRAGAATRCGSYGRGCKRDVQYIVAVLRSRIIFMRLRLRVKILMRLRLQLRLLPYCIIFYSMFFRSFFVLFSSDTMPVICTRRLLFANFYYTSYYKIQFPCSTIFSATYVFCLKFINQGFSPKHKESNPNCPILAQTNLKPQTPSLLPVL